jgi:hypothetical protein
MNYAKKFILVILSALIMAYPSGGIGLARSAASEIPTWKQVDIKEFIPSKGDYVLVGLDDAVGYLVNDSSLTYAQFSILSGQQKYVYYIGRYYYAATPEQTWAVKSKDIKKDRVTFSKTGEFLRLYKEGDPTPYGIHGYRYFQKEIEKGRKYLSMGCILVADESLDVIEKSFLANDKDLTVITSKTESNFPFRI